MVVFLCGTYADLAAERDAVLNVIRELQHDYQAMEFFGARPDRPIETCLNEVRSSDVVVVVLGFLYGSIVPGNDISYTQAEYDEAYNNGKTCLVYVRNEDSLIPAKFTERDPHKLVRLKSFRDLLESRHTVVNFADPPHLARQVAADLKRLAEKRTRPNPPEAAAAHSPEALLARELQIAAHLQRQLLPPSPLRAEACDVAGYWLESRSLGGDYYDFFHYLSGGVAIVMGDVSGKGVPAALLMSSLQARVRTHAEYGLSPAELVARLNRSLCAHMPSERFVTLLFAVLNAADGQLTYCNAGHYPGMLARADGSVERLSVGGMVVGLFADAPYTQDTMRLEVGDVLLLYSDGVAECLNAADVEFGDDRIAGVLRQYRNRAAEHVVQAIADAAREWTGGQFSDDISVVAARRLGS